MTGKTATTSARPADPCTLIIFGASGDLTHRLLLPALYTRFRSRIDHSFGEKLLSAMRNEFGGHVESQPPAHKAKDGHT